MPASEGDPMAATQGSRTTAGAAVWAIRMALVIATFLLLRYGTRLLAEWEMNRRLEFNDVWGWWAAVVVFLLAGVVLAVAARFPFAKSRYAWGRLVIAGLLLIPAIHVTAFMRGWAKPDWLLHVWWFDSLATAELSAVLAGVSIGCGFGARRAAGRG